MIDRLQALKIARIAYKELNDVIEKWNEGPIDYLKIDFHTHGTITVGEHIFLEHELVKYEEE